MEISNDTTCLDCYLESFEKSLSSKNDKPATLNNYRCLLGRFGRLLDAEGIAPSALTPDVAVWLGRRLPATPKSQAKIANLARLFVAHLIETGAAIRPPLTPAQAERAELASSLPADTLDAEQAVCEEECHIPRCGGGRGSAGCAGSNDMGGAA